MIVTDCLLVAYADDELDPETGRRLEGLLATAAELREKVEIFRETAMLLRVAYAPAVAPAPAAGLHRPERAGRRFGWAIAASIAAAIAGFTGGSLWTGALHSEIGELLDEIADYHPVYSRETAHMVEVPASRAGEVSAWLGGRLDRMLPIPDLTSAGLTFAGGRMLVANGRPVAQLMYTRGEGLPVALCISRIAGTAAPIQVMRRGPLHLVSWHDGAFAYVVAGELEEGAAQSIAAQAAQQL